MNYDCRELEDAKILRVKTIRSRIQVLEKDLLTQVNQGYQELLKNRRYAKYHAKLNHRIRLSEAFIKSVTSFYFDMLHDCEYLYLTPEVEIFQKVEKFNRNVLNSMKKVTENIDDEAKIKDRRTTESDSDAMEDDDEEEGSTKKKVSRKGKNTKIPIQQSWKLTQWLMQNFSYPYPTPQEKEEMSSSTGLTEQKVTNWFINAREREWKPYFPR